MNIRDVEARLVSALDWAMTNNIPLVKGKFGLNMYRWKNKELYIDREGVCMLTVLVMHALTVNEPKVNAGVTIETGACSYLTYRAVQMLGISRADVMGIVDGWDDDINPTDCTEWNTLGYKLGPLYGIRHVVLDP